MALKTLQAKALVKVIYDICMRVEGISTNRDKSCGMTMTGLLLFNFDNILTYKKILMVLYQLRSKIIYLTGIHLINKISNRVSFVRKLIF